MANIFLDTNYFIDAIHRRPERDIIGALEDHACYTSTLSVHIYCYIFKIRIPDSVLTAQLQKFRLIMFSNNILQFSLSGPTPDLEDNIQLHSAAEGECRYFLTRDRNLLKMTYFGKTRIVETLPWAIEAIHV